MLFQKIVNFLKSNGPATRPEIAKKLNVSVRSVSRVILPVPSGSKKSIKRAQKTFVTTSGYLGKGSHTNPAEIGLKGVHTGSSIDY